MAKRLTRHNGRAGKSGVYKSTHNDRTFDTEHAEHIDNDRIQQNIYWDCFRGATYPAQQDGEVSFADVERAFYLNRYSDYLDGQHERNAKRRHSERDRSVDDLLADKRFCPEETIYQIGTMEDSVSPDVLLEIVGEFMMEFERRFGEHVHVIDWALHLDEATPHIHERHVFDYVNRYGEVEPKQEKALEALGFELPDPEKKPGRTNNRKMVFDAVCRVILFDICKRHGLAVEEEPDPGNRGRSYLMKNDYIIQKQKKLIAEQETVIEEKTQTLEAVSLRLEDAEALIDEVTEIAYDKAVELVTDVVRAETQLQDEKIVSDYKDWCLAPERRFSPTEKGLIGKVLGKAQELIRKAAQRVVRNPPEKWLRVEGTHEAIISQDVFEVVQEQRARHHRECKNKQTQIFSGLLKCADCGWSMRYTLRSNVKKPYAFFNCGSYRDYHRINGKCSPHYIRYDALYAYVLARIQHWSAQAQQDDGKLLAQLLDAGSRERSAAKKKQVVELKKAEKRRSEVDGLFARLYEDWAAGRITEYNFNMLTAKYQTEQSELAEKIDALTAELDTAKQMESDARQWVELIRQYANPTELTAPLLNTLIEKILIHESIEGEDGEQEQEIEIFYRFIGKID